MDKAQFGMIGLGTMGRNFLLNIAEQGIAGVGYDLDATKRDLLLKEGKGLPLNIGSALPDFISRLASPRNIMLLVPAGPIVDSVINDLLPLLDENDLIIDGGNSHFTDTEVREKALAEKGVGFMGIGVSGGEEGARHGASIMPGGRRDFYDRIENTLKAVSAKVNDLPCVAYMGPGSAGHFVKMVHNGIEYGLMQILAETYDFMLRVLKMDYKQMSDTFASWNGTELNSFLVEVTAEVLAKIDAETGIPLVELVLDQAAQKGTGKWTSQAAMDLGVPIPTIDSAVSMRQISAQKETRVLVSQKYGSRPTSSDAQMESHGYVVTSERLHNGKADRARREVETDVSRQHENMLDDEQLADARHSVNTGIGHSRSKEIREGFHAEFDTSIEQLRNSLLGAFITTYAQGLSLLQAASIEKEYNLNIAEIARIWRGGCIIRSALLEGMQHAYLESPNLPNLLLDDRFAEVLHRTSKDWHVTVGRFSESRVPSLCLSSGLSYFEAFRSERLPANLIQAQRDYFGAHTYQRIDKEGIFHTPDWKAESEAAAKP
jgi:6-phosphogluconate dehydrogenase